MFLGIVIGVVITICAIIFLSSSDKAEGSINVLAILMNIFALLVPIAAVVFLVKSCG